MSTVFNFFRDSTFNPETKHQLWLSVVNDMHDSFCSCTRPFVHLLAILFTEEHKDRHLTVHNIITREYKQHKCLFGGQEEENIGMAVAALQEEEQHTGGEKENLTEEEIEELIAATDAAEEDTR